MLSRRTLFWLAFAVWAACYGWSFTAFIWFEPTGEGWVRGLNRLTHFLGWQIGAAVPAVVVWGLAGTFPQRTAGRWLGRLPVGLAAALLALILALIAYANLSRLAADSARPAEVPAPLAPTRPTGPPDPAPEG